MPPAAVTRDMPDSDFYLWHLLRLGVLDGSAPGAPVPSPGLWDAAETAVRPAKVALIDTGVDTEHPNLQGALARQIDFGPALSGVRYRPPHSDAAAAGGGAEPPEPADPEAAEPPGFAARKAALLAGLQAQGIADPAQLDIVSAYFAGPAPEVLRLEDPSGYFGAHGTACAGLVGGRPPLPGDAAEDPAAIPGAVPYFGVNPFCRILPIATPYSHEILPVIHALLHAWKAGADVILMPRGLSDPQARAQSFAGSPFTTRIDADSDDPVQAGDQASLARLTAQAGLLVALLRQISQECYVVLAAGNDGWAEALSYPAAASIGGSGKVVVVGAKNRDDRIATYSNGQTRSDILFMLSDDGVIVDRRDIAYDDRRGDGYRFDYTALTGGEGSRYNPWGLLSLDLRGSYGYAAGTIPEQPEPGEPGDTGSLYSVFGGTSAASSLMAGLIALLIQSGQIARAPLAPAALRSKIAEFYPAV